MSPGLHGGGCGSPHTPLSLTRRGAACSVAFSRARRRRSLSLSLSLSLSQLPHPEVRHLWQPRRPLARRVPVAEGPSHMLRDGWTQQHGQLCAEAASLGRARAAQARPGWASLCDVACMHQQRRDSRDQSGRPMPRGAGWARQAAARGGKSQLTWRCYTARLYTGLGTVRVVPAVPAALQPWYPKP
jgi:hypothetical protein